MKHLALRSAAKARLRGAKKLDPSQRLGIGWAQDSGCDKLVLLAQIGLSIECNADDIFIQSFVAVV